MAIRRPQASPRIVVTGGTLEAGHWIVEHLVERGHDVVNVDVQLPSGPGANARGGS